MILRLAILVELRLVTYRQTDTDTDRRTDTGPWLYRGCIASHGKNPCLFVRPSVWLWAEGPRDATSCRGTRITTSSSVRPIATDAQQWRGRSIHAACCYWGYGRTTGWPMYRLCLAFLVDTNACIADVFLALRINQDYIRSNY